MHQRGSTPASSQKRTLAFAAACACFLMFYLTDSSSTVASDFGRGKLVPDGGKIVDLIVPASAKASVRAEAEKNQYKIQLTEEDVQWLDCLSTGWAAPFTGFMREHEYLETIHFNSVLIDDERVSSPIPITLAISANDKAATETASTITLLDHHGKAVALLDNPEFFGHRKEERIARTFGAMDLGHPYIQRILNQGPWLVGGDLRVIERITYDDGLDQYRLTPVEIFDEFQRRGADSVVAFQTRNPTHAAHAFLMNEGVRRLRDQGKKTPMLWLSTLGGWTKDDDVPLKTRVQQHLAIIEGGMLDSATTLMAIWPSPMIYAGPTEVLWHAKSRRNAGATAFITGRDPAGMKRSSSWTISLEDPRTDPCENSKRCVERKLDDDDVSLLGEITSESGDDIYNGDDGRYVLSHSPGLRGMDIFTFGKIGFNAKKKEFTYFDETHKEDFVSISGSKMRKLAREGGTPPEGFMHPNGWAIVVKYYQDLQAGNV